MYFSRQEFNPQAEVAEAARQGAAEAERLAAQHFGIQLDRSYESLAEVDRVLELVRQMLLRVRLTREMAEPFARPFGSYFGELLRERHGGDWGILRVYSDQVPALSLGTSGPVLVPWARTLDRILKEDEQSLVDYCASVQRALETPATSPDALGPPREHYPLRHDNGYFDTGATGDGRQVIMSFSWGGLIAVFFDRDGSLLDWEVRPLPREPDCHPVSGRMLHSPEFDAAVEAATRSWKRELNLHEQPIRVRRFSIDELGVGIEDLSDDDEDFLKAPEMEEPEEEERLERWKSLREWWSSGSFVLYWGNDLWLDGDGNVTSS